MAKRNLLLALEFVALSVPLTWLWILWGQHGYSELLLRVAGPLLHPLGVTELVDSPARKRFVNYVPFVVLMAITPGLSARRRGLGLLLGLPAIFCCHVALVAVEAFSHSARRPTADPFSTVFPAALFTDAFPFILWAILAQRVLRRGFSPPRGAEGAGP
jgi:hypothetical protein